MSKTKPNVSIKLDKVRHVRLDLNAMASYEEVTGKSMFKGVDLENMGAIELRALLWSCLVHEDGKLTLKQVGSFITVQNMNEVSTNIASAFSDAMPDSEGKQEDPLPANPPAG